MILNDLAIYCISTGGESGLTVVVAPEHLPCLYPMIDQPHLFVEN